MPKNSTVLFRLGAAWPVMIPFVVATPYAVEYPAPRYRASANAPMRRVCIMFIGRMTYNSTCGNARWSGFYLEPMQASLSLGALDHNFCLDVTAWRLIKVPWSSRMISPKSNSVGQIHFAIPHQGSDRLAIWWRPGYEKHNQYP